MSTSNPFKVGDTALRKDQDLDARPVSQVRGGEIKLAVGTAETQWLPHELYECIPYPPEPQT